MACGLAVAGGAAAQDASSDQAASSEESSEAQADATPATGGSEEGVAEAAATGAAEDASDATSDSSGSQAATDAPSDAPGPEPVASSPIASTEVGVGSANEQDAAAQDAHDAAAQDDLPPGLRRRAPLDDEPVRLPDVTPPREPWRVVASLGIGGAVRLAELQLQQERLAPAYLELRAGVTLPQRGRIGHELTLGLTTNVARDGTYTAGVDALEQWVVAPAYGVRVGFPHGPVPDFVLRGRVGLPVVLTPDVTWGVEVDASLTYALLAGLGVYVELGYATYFGAEDRAGDRTTHPVLALELGVALDWEVLR